MNRDYKIEKINAYKKLIETKRLPKAPEGEKGVPRVEDEILDEFSTWANLQLAKLLGEETKPSQTMLTEEERVILKGFAQKLIQKSLQPEASTPTQVARAAPQPNKTRPAASGTAIQREEEERDPAIPLGNRLRKPKSGTTVLDALDDLDRQGPEF